MKCKQRQGLQYLLTKKSLHCTRQPRVKRFWVFIVYGEIRWPLMYQISRISHRECSIKKGSLLNCVPCVLKMCSRANVPCVLMWSRANVPCVLSAHVPACLVWLRAHVPTWLACSRANVPCLLMCSHVNVLCLLTSSRANFPCVHTCQRASFDVTIFSFAAIVAEITHTVDKL